MMTGGRTSDFNSLGPKEKCIIHLHGVYNVHMYALSVRVCCTLSIAQRGEITEGGGEGITAGGRRGRTRGEKTEVKSSGTFNNIHARRRWGV